MKKTKKRTKQLAAIIALFAIVISVVGTGILVILSNSQVTAPNTLDLEDFLNSYTGSTDSLEGSETQTGIINEL